jgi:uncharacterized protein YndB with AHSA1/START domain
MSVTRRRLVAAPRERVWSLVGDPWHEPRWWPRVERVELVTKRGWTSVLRSKRDRLVRVDWTVEVDRRPDQRRWAQELVGTPFERLFTRNAVEVRLEPAEGGTLVALELDQQLRGSGRWAPWLFRRGHKRQLEAALDGLEAAV